MLSSPILRIVSGVVLAVFPSTLMAAESKPAAMLYAHGPTTLNGNSVPSSSALFPGDLVQTDEHSVANINASGSVVLVRNESLVQYQGNTLTLKRGSITIATSKSLTARVGDVTVSPAGNVLTDFEITHANGKVQVAARTGNLVITDNTGTTQLAQGQETTRDGSQTQGNDKEKGSASPSPMSRGLMNSPIAIAIGGAAIAGLAIWVIVHGDEPASPTK